MLERSQIFVSTNRFDFRTFYMQNKLPNALYVICAVLRSRLRQLLLSTIQKISSKLNDLSILRFSLHFSDLY